VLDGEIRADHGFRPVPGDRAKTFVDADKRTNADDLIGRRSTRDWRLTLDW
jgi:hypothetical protein